jgi:hypothetical protein
LRPFIDWAVKKGHCDKREEPEQMVDTRFWDYARAHPIT